MHPSDSNAPTQLIDLLEHEFDSPDQVRAAAPLDVIQAAEPTEPPARSRATLALAFIALLLTGVLAAVLVVPLGVGRTTSAVASPTLSAPTTTAVSTSSTPTSSSAPPSSEATSTTARVAPSTVVIVAPTTTLPRPTTTEAPTTSSSTTSSTTTSTTTPKTPAQIVTFTGVKTVPCLGKLGNGEGQLTFATKNATSVELSADGGTPKPLGATSGKAGVVYSCAKPVHTYTLIAHSPDGDAKQSVTIG